MGEKFKLDGNAAQVAGQLTEQLLTPLHDTLARFETIFPGITERVREVINPEAIKAALSAEAARSIQSFIEEGTEDSLNAALLKVKELRSLVERGGSVDLEAVKELMPGKVVGPDARIFKGRDIGEVPQLPADLLSVLKSRCVLANDGRTVAETHRLVLLPATIDGEPLTLNSLRELATTTGKRRDPSFYKQDWYDDEAFANAPLGKSVWVLEYADEAPDTLYKNDSEQVAVVGKLSDYRTARVLEHVGTMVLQYLENAERIYPNFHGRCEERSASGARVSAGYFDADGLGVNYHDVDDRAAALGRAVVRKLNT
jgi:hypothetical protein